MKKGGGGMFVASLASAQNYIYEFSKGSVVNALNFLCLLEPNLEISLLLTQNAPFVLNTAHA